MRGTRDEEGGRFKLFLFCPEQSTAGDLLVGFKRRKEKREGVKKGRKKRRILGCCLKGDFGVAAEGRLVRVGRVTPDFTCWFTKVGQVRVAFVYIRLKRLVLM